MVTSGQDHSPVQPKVLPVPVNRSYGFRGEGLSLFHRPLSGKRCRPLGTEDPGQDDSGLSGVARELSVEGRKEHFLSLVPTRIPDDSTACYDRML